MTGDIGATPIQQTKLLFPSVKKAPQILILLVQV